MAHGGALPRTDNALYIQYCDCVTYDSDLCSVSFGECPYGCGFTVISSWSGQVYNPLRIPNNLNEYNEEICGRLNCDGPLGSKCRKDFSPLIYSYDLKCVSTKHSQYNWLKFVAVVSFHSPYFILS